MDEKEVQEFTLEDIMKEFGDDTDEVAEKTPEQILSEVERQVRIENGEEPEEAAASDRPREEENEEEKEEAPTPDLSGETIRFDKVADVKGTVRGAQIIDDEEEEAAEEVPEETAEPYSEEWEPDYEQPIADYRPQPVIPFQVQRSRRRELKKKLVEGPERMYYALSERGLGKLQLAIFLSVILVLISSVATILYAFGAVPENRLRFMVFWQFFAMLVAALLGSFQLLEGITDLYHKKFTLNTMLVFSFILCCADGILCFRQVRVPCCAAFGLQVTMSLWNAYHKRNTKLGKLDTMRKATRLDAVTAVEDYYEGNKGLLRGEGRVEDFMNTVDESCGLEKVVDIYALVALCVSVAAGIFTGILHGYATGIQVAAVTTLAAVPASMFITLSRPEAVLERRLHKLGTVLCGWQGVKGLAGKAVFPLDHNDLFPAGTVKMNGVKFYSKRAPDEIVAYAAALVAAGGGVLEPLFTHLLESRNGRHYEATEFRYYEEGGIGGQVAEEAVLAGSIEFLKAMGVETPEGIRVNRAVCVAIDGELCGIFAFTYEKDRGAQAGLGTLCSYRGLLPLVTTGDFTVNQTLVKELFRIKTKRLTFPEFETRAQLTEKKPEAEAQAHALYTAEGLAPAAYAVTGARALKYAATAGLAVHMIGGILGIVMMLILGYLGQTQLLTPANMFLYELVLMIPGILITEWTRSV